MQLDKFENHRNREYLNWLCTQRCVVSHRPSEVAHHMRSETNGGKGIKPSDYFCIPLTHNFHTNGQFAVHRMGEKKFCEKFCINKIELFINFLKKYLLEKYEKSLDLSNKSTSTMLHELINEIESKKDNSLNELEERKKDEVKKIQKLHNKKLYLETKEQRKVIEKEIYEKSKEYKKKMTSQYLVENNLSKVSATKMSETDSYKKAQQLKKAYYNEVKEKNKKIQSEYRKKMYKLAKVSKKEISSQLK